MTEEKSDQKLVDIIMKLFVNRSDTFCIQQSDSTYRRIDRRLKKSYLKSHLLGKMTIGTYQIDPNDNSVKWICFDIDEKIANSKQITKKIHDCVMKKFGEKTVLLEASRYPDMSYHIWTFFEHPIPAYIARYLGKKILKKCKLEKTGIELFPKQDRIHEDGYGNLVKLPLGIHRKHGKKSSFLDPQEMKPVSNEMMFSVKGIPCEEEIHGIFSSIDSNELKEVPSLLADYWLDFCEYPAGKVWHLLEQWNKSNKLSLSNADLAEVMRSINRNQQEVKRIDSEDKETDFQKQTIMLDKKASILDIPCVKAFRTTAIPPSKRHNILGKNLSILYLKTKGNFVGFEDFCVSLAKNQPFFDERSLDWRKWVEIKPRSFNCIEVKNYLESEIPRFSCTNCPLRVEVYYLHPAGGLNEFFVYEPIGQGEYVYKTVTGKRGISKLIEKDNSILIEGQKFFFEKKPPRQWFFHLPKKSIIQNWVNGTKKSKSPTELWINIQVCLQMFLDIPNKHEFAALTLFVLQSWMSEILDTVFYCSIQGEFGGGKTVCGEAVIPMCRHGYQTGNLSSAFVPRVIETQKVTLGIDELDSIGGIRDSDLYQILRQGYRRGTMYSRINPNTMETESFVVFGPKIFSLHSSVEAALQSRTLTIHVRETEDFEYPIIGLSKGKFAREVRDELLLWYLDNILEIRDKQLSMVDMVDQVDLFGDGVDQQISIEDLSSLAKTLRNKLFKQSTTHLKDSQLSQLRQLKGRNVELAHIIMIVSNIFEIDTTNVIKKIFEQKTTEETEPLETGRMGVLKDVLIDIWEAKKGDNNYLTDTGYVKVSNKEVFENYNTALDQKKYNRVSDWLFKGYLTEFGFTDTINRKKMKVPTPSDSTPKSRLCNIFTPRVLEKLGVETKESSENDSTTDTEQIVEEES